MTRTPLRSASINSGKDASSLPQKIPAGSGAADSAQSADTDQQLLDVMRTLNLAVAVVAQAREKRLASPDQPLGARSVHEAMIHLKEAAQRLDELRRALPDV